MPTTTVRNLDPEAVTAEVDRLVVDIFGDRNLVSRVQLAAGAGVSLDVIRWAVAHGDLTEIRSGPRTCRFSRPAVRRWLLASSGVTS